MANPIPPYGGFSGMNEKAECWKIYSLQKGLSSVFTVVLCSISAVYLIQYDSTAVLPIEYSILAVYHIKTVFH